MEWPEKLARVYIPPMRAICVTLAAVFCMAFIACGGNGTATRATTTAAAPAATEVAAAKTTESPTASGDNTTVAPATPTAIVLNPSIADALSCRVPPVRPATGPGSGAFQRYDLTAFPLAACNDGSPAVLYFRPYAGDTNRDKWLIVLNGGGGCDTGEECAKRWCGVDTNFNADNMSTANASNGVGGGGILAREAGNPFADYNQVEVRYCTSDAWAGRGMAVTTTAMDPKTGATVTYQIHFAGAHVYEAVMATLRQDGVPALVYRRDNMAMPDLDDAAEVVFAGGSAGGAGVINNLDRLADMLREGSNKPVVRGFVEAIVGPDRSLLGYDSATFCKENELCSYEVLYKGIYARQTAEGGQRSWTDDSCIEWHRANEPGTEWQCYDPNHLLANHITTPYFVRTSLTDQLLSSNFIDAGFTTATGQPLTILEYGRATAAFVNGLQSAVERGHEHEVVAVLPGVFAPSCSTHYTLLQSDLVNGVSISVAGGPAYTLFDAWNHWVTGTGPSVIVTSAPRTDVCPGER